MPPIANPENITEPGASAAVSRSDPTPPSDRTAPFDRTAPPLGRTPERMDDDWSHVVLCIALCASFAFFAYWKSDLRGFAVSGLFALLAVILIAMNLAQSRR